LRGRAGVRDWDHNVKEPLPSENRRATRLLRAPGRRRRLVLLFVAAAPLAVMAFILLTQPFWAFSVLERVFPAMIFRVETDDMVVPLSFDDGPDDVHTARVLEVLARHGAHATFFMIGDRAGGRQEIARGGARRSSVPYARRATRWAITTSPSGPPCARRTSASLPT